MVPSATWSASVTGVDGDEVLRLKASIDAGVAFRVWSLRLTGWLPDCLVAEVGSTGVTGLPTKGDLDVAVVAPDAVAWSDVVARLGPHLEPHEPEHWSATWASFRGTGESGEVGVQVVVAHSEEDTFLRGFRTLLLQDPAVVARYATLKEHYDGRSMREYRVAKGRFVQREVLAQTTSS